MKSRGRQSANDTTRQKNGQFQRRRSCGRKVTTQATTNPVGNQSRGIHMQVPTLCCSLPNGATQYGKAMFATSSTPHEEVGFPWITLTSRTRRPLQSKRTSTLLLAHFVFLDLPTGPLLPQASRCDFRRDLFDVLALVDYQQPTEHGKRQLRAESTFLSQTGRLDYNLVNLPTSGGLLDLVCRLGSGTHTHEKR